MLFQKTLVWCFIMLCVIETVITYELKKCCPLNHIINSEMNECIKKENKSSDWTIEQLKAFNYKFISDEDELNIPCSLSETLILNWSDGNNSDFHIDKNTGNLITFAAVGKNKTFDVNDYCLDEMVNEDGNISTVAITCKCNNATCVAFCCDYGSDFYLDSDDMIYCNKSASTMINRKITNISVPFNDQQFFTVPRSPECFSRPLRPFTFEYGDLNFKILSNGTLYIKFEYPDNNSGTYFVPEKFFCVGVAEAENSFQESVSICSKFFVKRNLEQENIIFKFIYTTFFIIASIFFFLTFILHLILPKLRLDIMRLSLMSHCACMVAAYICFVAISKVGIADPDLQCEIAGKFCLVEFWRRAINTEIPCKIIGYLLQYFMLAGSCWLHVMCLDIATTFRSFRNMVRRNASETLTKFFYYVPFGVGLPIIITTLTFIADKYLDTKTYGTFKPNIGNEYCFFNPFLSGILIFYYGPLGIILFINVLLFVFSTYKIFQLMNNPKLQGQKTNDRAAVKQRVILSIKLFALMGIPWLIEIIMSVIGKMHILYYLIFIDAVHVIRSIFVFKMFCWKPEVLNMLKERFGSNKAISACLPNKLNFCKEQIEDNLEETYQQKTEECVIQDEWKH